MNYYMLPSVLLSVNNYRNRLSFEHKQSAQNWQKLQSMQLEEILIQSVLQS